MTATSNKTLIFKAIPVGFPVEGKDLAIEDRPIDLASPPPGGLIYKVHYASFDPYQRGRMRSPEVKSYAPAFTVGSPITNKIIASVVKSDTSKFKKGDILTIEQGDSAEYGVLPEGRLSAAQHLVNKYNLDPKLYLGPLGMSGLTAYSSLFEIGRPEKGEVIFVSSAAGSVGGLSGQIAKLKGLKVIGSVGSDEKVDYVVKQLGFDAAFNYKKEKPSDALKRLAPEGIDIYYENVGGEHLEAALDALRDHGRVIACGMISQYNLAPTPGNPDPRYPIRNLADVVTKRLTIRGFIVSDPNISGPWSSKHKQDVEKWLHDGSINFVTDTTRGIDNAATGFVNMLHGRKLGKSLLEVSPLPGWEGK